MARHASRVCDALEPRPTIDEHAGSLATFGGWCRTLVTAAAALLGAVSQGGSTGRRGGVDAWMKATLLALFALGCTAGRGAAHSPAPARGVLLRTNPSRASLDRRQWNLVATSPDDGDPCRQVPVPVVARTRDAVQIVDVGDDALLALWLDRDDLAPVVRRATSLWAAPPSPSDAPVGRVQVGVPVTVRERRAGFAHVAIAYGPEYARGWLLERDLDVVSRPARSRPTGPAAASAAWTRRGLRATPTADAPDLGGNGYVARVDVIGRADAWAHVRYAGVGIDLDGWIEAAAIHTGPIDFDSHVGCSHGDPAVRVAFPARDFGAEAVAGVSAASPP